MLWYMCTEGRARKHRTRHLLRNKNRNGRTHILKKRLKLSNICFHIKTCLDRCQIYCRTCINPRTALTCGNPCLGLSTFSLQNGQVLHCDGRKSYSEQSAFPFRELRSKKMQSNPFPRTCEYTVLNFDVLKPSSEDNVPALP